MRVCLLSCVITRNLFMSRKKRSNNPFAHLRLFHVCAFFAVLYEIIANQSFSNLIPSKIKYLSRKRIDLNKFFLFRQMFFVIWKRESIFFDREQTKYAVLGISKYFDVIKEPKSVALKIIACLKVLLSKILHFHISLFLNLAVLELIYFYSF